MEQGWYNPSAAYAPAARVFVGLKQARQLLCDVTGLAGRVLFTSGGTEANNTAILSALKRTAHYITSTIEHPSVYATFKRIESMGVRVDYVKPRKYGILADDVAELVCDDTALVSIMHVNNETGALNDIGDIARAVKARNARAAVHSDGVQALFKTPLSLQGVDYYTVSAHKIHALKGTGALVTAADKAIKPMHYGGEQEQKMRPGTENTLGVQAFAQALESGRDSYEKTALHCNELQQRLIDGLSVISDAVPNMPEAKVPHIINVSFLGVRAEVLVRALGERGIYVGTGAACSRGKLSRVLLESGISRDAAESAVRISLSGDNTKEDIDICLGELERTLRQLRKFGRR
jgi:cysteine desulfurase